MASLKVSAPGRICLFGEHQDFLGLPVVAAAIDLRFYIRGTTRQDSLLRISMPDIGKRDEIDLSQPVVYNRKRDYLRSCINVLRRKGWDLPHGYDCRMHSAIPINAGVSSSSAMITAWLKFLLTAAGQPDAYAPEDLARLAHQAEVVEFGEPGGMMDHFASAMGNFIYVDCRPPFKAEYLPLKLDGFILGDSLEKKETLGVLSGSKDDVLNGIKMLEGLYPGFDLHTTLREAVWDLLDKLPEVSCRKIKANLINRDLTIEAMSIFRKGIDPIMLGDLLYRHHEQLRDGMRVSTQKIDRMLESAREAGALGGKINGSGGGGAMFVYAPGKEGEAAEALERAGGKAFKLTIDAGARVEE